MRGQPRLHAHAVDPDDRDVEVDVAQRQLGQRADELVGLASCTAAAHHELDVRRTASSAAMLSALVTTRRPECDARARATSVVVEPPFSPTEVTSPPSSAGGAPRDRTLGFVPLAAAVAHRQLVEHAGGDRAAVRAGQQLLALQQLQVAPDRRLRHPSSRPDRATSTELRLLSCSRMNPRRSCWRMRARYAQPLPTLPRSTLARRP